MENIRNQVVAAAASVGGRPVIDEALLEEVAALVEWPMPIVAGFDESFLELPDAVLVATMKGHQRYFHVVDDDAALLPHFIAISNIDSRRPESVREGNERVIRPRLSDAKFFFDTDLKQPLAQRRTALAGVVFQEKLGTMLDKTKRVARLAGRIAIAMGEGAEQVRFARRAGMLCKCDLLTEVVGEFPELQGTMGAEYARRDGEPEAVCAALAEAYLPRFAGDGLPQTRLGQALAIADKLDTLVGIFGIGGAPTGDRDPFGLRRAALGVLRIIIERELDLELPALLADATRGHGEQLEASNVTGALMRFMTERLRAYFVDQGIPVDVFAAVQAREPSRPHDFARRVRAVNEFRRLPQASSLAAANKRISNILRQAGGESIPDRVDDTLLAEDAEWNLAAKIFGLGPRVRELLRGGDYTGAMTSLAGLRDNVDEFFDTVTVMDENESVKRNRLALLKSISNMFLETADISRLQA